MYNIRKSIVGKNIFDSKNSQIGKAWNNASNNARAIVLTKVQPNTTYTISFNSISGIEGLYWFDRVNKDDSTYVTGNTQITQTTTITTKPNVNWLGIQFNKTNITQADIDNVLIQIEQNSVKTSYEPYENSYITIQDGIETPLVSCNIEGNSYQAGNPTPTNPKEIKVVEAINILPNNQTTQEINGITFTVNNDKSVTVDGTSTDVADLYFVGTASEYVDLGLKTGTYTLSGCTTGSGTTYMLYCVQNRNGTLTYIQNQTTGVNISVQSGDTFRIFIRVLSGQTLENVTIYPQLEEGSIANEYIPYNNIKINVSGKNLFDKSTVIGGWIRYDGTIYNQYTDTFGYTPFIRVKPNTKYTLSLYNNASLTSGGVCEYNSNNSFITGVAETSTTINFTTTATTKYVRFTVRQDSKNNVMLEEGETASTYEAYQGTSTTINLQGNFLARIDDYKDELSIDDAENIILTKKTGKIVLNGTEEWNNQSGLYDTNNRMMFACSLSGLTGSNMANRKGLSNYFVNYSGTVQNVNVDVTAFNFHPQETYSKVIYIKIDKSVLPTLDVDGFKSWLSSHNTEIYYQLAEPYEINLGKANIELNEGLNYITIITKSDTRNTVEYEVDTSSFREKSYSGESNYRANLKIYHNSTENVIDMSQIARITIKDPIIDTTSQIFYLGSFVAKSLTIKFKNFDGIEITSGDKVTLEIGQLIDEEYIDIPIGEFYIDELAENYQTTCEIVCNDASVKFKQAVDYSSCFVDNKATIDTILNEICRICDVPLGKYPTTNGDIEIGTFNNAISGKQWISYIAELKGCNAKIDRYGRLTLIPLKQTSKVSINASESSSWNLGEKYLISQVRYYNGSIWYESPVDPENTQNILYIRNDNPFISSNETLDNIYDVIGECEIYNVKTTNYGDITLDAYDNITYELDENSYQTLNDNTIVYEMSLMTTVENKISTKQQETTTNVVAGNANTRLRTVETKVDLVDAKVTQTITDISDLQTETTEIEQSTDAITTRINGMSTSINDLGQQVTQFNETYEERTKNSYTLWFSESGIEGDIESLQNAMNNNSEEITSIKKYIRQVSGNIELGEEGSQMKVVISNDRISFYTGNDESAYISQDKLYITDSTILNKLQVGNWETKEDSNHNLNTRWLG